MKGRTEGQIIKKFGKDGLVAAKCLKNLGFVKTENRGNETIYRM